MNAAPARRDDSNRGQNLAPNPSKTAPAGWFSRPVGRGWVILVGTVILALPLWLWADTLDGYLPRAEGMVGLMARVGRVFAPFDDARLISDDFDYLAEARTWGELRRHLWVSHNSHVVPLFRAWTFLWGNVAGTLARLPETFAQASILTYFAAILLIGRLVGRETGRAALGLASMAVFGVSAVLEPTVLWYSAGQAIAAGVCILAMLVALQGWRWRGGGWRLVLAAVATGAAPLVWTVGLIAGPVGFVYLWADGRPRARRAAIVPMLATAAVAATVFAFSGKEVTASKNFHGRGLTEAADPVQGLLSTAQATVEVLIARNLGLSTETTPVQAVALLILLAGAWATTRKRPWRLNPLEAAGGTIVLLAGGMVYTARGYFPFEQLRDLHWYLAVPQIGAVLFAAGWWSGRSEGAVTGQGVTTRGELLAVVGLVALVMAIQPPRVRANLVASVPPMTASERARFPIPTLQRLRARYLSSERAARQRRDLARFDQAEARARSEGWGRQAIRKATGGPFAPRIADRDRQRPRLRPRRPARPSRHQRWPEGPPRGDPIGDASAPYPRSRTSPPLARPQRHLAASFRRYQGRPVILTETWRRSRRVRAASSRRRAWAVATPERQRRR